MAYAALISLVETLKHFLHHDESPLDPPTKQQLRPLYQTITSLQSHLEKIYPVTRSIRDRVNALEIETRLAMYEAQDKIESLIFRRANPEPGPEERGFPDELQGISIKIEEIARTAKEIADSIEQPEGDESRKLLLRSPSAIILKHRIVGQEEDFRLLTEKLMAEASEREVLSIHGMAGIGKTTLARSIYDDPHIERHFPVRAWVTVTTEYSIVEIYSRLLRSIDSLSQKSEEAASRFGEKTRQETESELGHKVYQSLYGNRYLIIVDDMWDIKVWDRVQRNFPSGGRVILTTRDEKIAKEASLTRSGPGFTHEMKLLSVENSWILLCDRAFKGGNCPPRLENSGRKIAENCKGLPLSLVVVGGQLSQESKTVDYWRTVEEDINKEAAKSEQPYLEILSLSYSNLPSNLKACFLYMSAFPEDSEIPLSKLIKLWVGEGFLTNSDRVKASEGEPAKTLEDIAEENLKDLINRNLFSVRSLSSNGHDIKTCGIHDVLRDLSVRESQCQLFFHTINRYIKELKEGAKTQRRLSIHKNILMCMEDVYSVARLMKDVRAIIYAGRHHHHPMPFCLTFDLLRILDALTMYFIEFPDELIKLVHLRFLSLTYNGQVPSSISKLTNLHVLAVRQHPKIIYVGVSVLPPEIWKMSQLRHIVFTESELPELPKASSILFENLQTLTNVNIASCTEEVLGHMPNLKKLGMWTISPGEFGFYFDKLQKLEDFKLTVLCPIPGKKIGFMPKLFFPETIRKLCLSGCGISWDDMSIVGRLPKLEVLKLREFACQGEAWEPNDGEFSEVKFLLLEALDLQNWYAEDTNFPSLRCLIINHCYNLEEVPEGIGGVAGLSLIEMVDCGPTAVDSLEKIKGNQLDLNKHLRVRIYTSWK